MDPAVRPTTYCDEPEAVAGVMLQHVRRHRLLDKVARLGLAVSGGADSVALFHLLLPVCRAAGIDVTLLHLNHGLRPEAVEEAEFVRTLAASEGVQALFETLRLAERTADGMSLEMSARNARLSFFARCCREAGLNAVATGHQADDVAETLLLRLARGAGGSGLSGLRPRSAASPYHARLAGQSFSFIRPLLAVSGGALRAWLRLRNLPWREDASNRDCSIPRNLLRNVLLPQLEQAWGSTFRPSLSRSAELLRSDDALLDQMAERRMKNVCPDDAVDLVRLLRQPEALQRRMLRHWLFRQNQPEACGYESVLRLLEFCRERTAFKLQLGSCTYAAADEGWLRLAHTGAAVPAEVALPLGSRLNWGGLVIAAERSCGVASVANGVGSYPAVCTLDAKALHGRTLSVRSRKPGDRIAPTGMAGSKKIQDLFVDSKVSEEQRSAVPLFVCGDEVVWVPGYRVARNFRVPAPDAPCLRLTVSARPGASR